jgi:hypothetical protein
LNNGDHDAVKRMLESEQYILNDDYQGNLWDTNGKNLKSKDKKPPNDQSKQNNSDLAEIESASTDRWEVLLERL